MYHELLQSLVVDTKVIDYQYFMDEMENYELRALSKIAKFAHRQSANETRLLMYSFAPPKNPMSLHNYYPLDTDKIDTVERLEGDDLKLAREKVRQAFRMK